MLVLPRRSLSTQNALACNVYVHAAHLHCLACLKVYAAHLSALWVAVQLLFGEHPFEKAADVEEGSVKRTLHRILKVAHDPWPYIAKPPGSIACPKWPWPCSETSVSPPCIA